MAGDSFSAAMNANQTNIHNINQPQLPSQQQVNLNASNRMTPTPNEAGPMQQQMQQQGPPNSNVMGNKGACGSNGGGGSVAEYMQTQNHIFVFSTALANRGAEAVLNGQFPSIVAYHCSQPRTKEFLKVSTFVSQAWYGNQYF